MGQRGKNDQQLMLVISEAETTWFTIPIRWASAPVKTRAVKINSLANAGDKIRGSLCVPPAPGMIASLVSTKPILAFSAAVRISQARAISKPPPSAAPSKAAITGMGSCSIFIKSCRNCVTNSLTSLSDMPLRSFKSAPAQNTPGVKLRKTTTRELLSFFKSTKISENVSTKSRLKAFLASGRLRPNTVIPL
uniref:Uncharacterized protein n=1 Tax=Glossina austeni TaxID=7395 RepID=A0A1A9V7K2_GLOAU